MKSEIDRMASSGMGWVGRDWMEAGSGTWRAAPTREPNERKARDQGRKLLKAAG